MSIRVNFQIKMMTKMAWEKTYLLKFEFYNADRKNEKHHLTYFYLNSQISFTFGKKISLNITLECFASKDEHLGTALKRLY